MRRQCDSDRHALSLLRLIGQLKHHRRAFTREWYVVGWLAARREGHPDGDAEDEASSRQDANAIFDRYTDEPGAKVLRGPQLRRDRDELLAASTKVNAFVTTPIVPLDWLAPFWRLVEHSRIRSGVSRSVRR